MMIVVVPLLLLLLLLLSTSVVSIPTNNAVGDNAMSVIECRRSICIRIRRGMMVWCVGGIDNE